MTLLNDKGQTVCEECDGVTDTLVYFGQRECECRMQLVSVQNALSFIDIEKSMTFDRLTDSDESVTLARIALEEISSGDRMRGVLMVGLPGRGKTHLAVACIRELMERRKYPGVYNVAEVVTRIQSTYGYTDSFESRHKILEEVFKPQVVLLDDLGKERKTQDVESIIYEIIDGLYRRRRTLICCSNLPGKEFVERYDDAVRSRLLAMSERFVIKGEDRRQAAWDW